MENEKVCAMKFASVYPLLIAKAERKGRTREEVDAAAYWLTGYTPGEIEALLEGDMSYGDFFRQAPHMNEKRGLVGGSVCGVRIESIDEPLMRDIRRLDKLVDELAKGRPLEKVLRE